MKNVRVEGRTSFLFVSAVAVIMTSLKKKISEEEISLRVDAIASAIRRDYEGGDIVVLCVLSGSIIFIADLIRRLDMSILLDMVSVSSYRGKSIEPSRLQMLKMFSGDVRGKDVLIVDDICDTGATLAEIVRRVNDMGPASLKTCVFLDKPARHRIDIKPDYIGFEVDDGFVAGYGLDYNGRFRNLPYVAEIEVVSGGDSQ